jgi:hypothetical protein
MPLLHSTAWVARFRWGIGSAFLTSPGGVRTHKSGVKKSISRLDHDAAQA